MGSNPIRNKHGQSKFIRSGGLVAPFRPFDPPILPGLCPRASGISRPSRRMVAQVIRPRRPGTKQLDHDEADTRQVWSKRAHEGAVARRGEIAVRVTSSKGHERIFFRFTRRER